MKKCHKCEKPVYFAERRQSIGYDWHPECLRCQECGRRLDPGQHAEHKGVPYCHVPCYAALFGPQLFGHGTRVESHKSFGQKGPIRSNSTALLPRTHLESKLKVFNQFHENIGKSGEVRSREVNGRLVLEGSLRVYWGVQAVIHLKEDVDQRTLVTRGRAIEVENKLDAAENSNLDKNLDSGISSMSSTENTSSEDNSDASSEQSCQSSESSLSPSQKCLTLPPKLDIKQIDWDELDELLQVERVVDDSDKIYQTMPNKPMHTSDIEKPSKVQQTDPMDSMFNLSRSMIETTDKNDSDDIVVQFSKSCDKSPRPIDPSRINDSLKLYTESVNKNNNLSDVYVRRDIQQEVLNENVANEKLAAAALYDSDDDDKYYMKNESNNSDKSSEEYIRKNRSTAIKRRSGKRRSRTKLQRRCSINGHFYNRETSFFTPPHGSQMNVWVSSLLDTRAVISLLLDKYKVDSKPDNFALFVVRDNGEQKRLAANESPLVRRILLGPHEDVARVFLMDSVARDITPQVAQFLNLSIAECKAILQQYDAEEQREIARIQERYKELSRRILQRMETLKVRL
ncbi:uncharacterized protein LOC113363657 [Ctenocephalides felis]|uniref:uncharacterized protein LOC113363657 n=1 Tax=Ctenocephalides felis TaxID=7515 RepID=UPI000E6E427E|nr:uncharacterized protein LOC113363657 [Ctenocephalides felis]